MTELTDLALSQVSDMLASGEITAVELVEANLRTIERTEPVVHAYANVLADEALAAAREADTEIAAIGIFITLEFPTQAMQREALAAGYYQSDFWKKQYRKLQILSIRDLLGSDGVDMPPQHGTHRQAERYKSTDGKSQRDLI